VCGAFEIGTFFERLEDGGDPRFRFSPRRMSPLAQSSETEPGDQTFS
jgi:hypothetical protein